MSNELPEVILVDYTSLMESKSIENIMDMAYQNGYKIIVLAFGRRDEDLSDVRKLLEEHNMTNYDSIMPISFAHTASRRKIITDYIKSKYNVKYSLSGTYQLNALEVFKGLGEVLAVHGTDK